VISRIVSLIAFIAFFPAASVRAEEGDTAKLFKRDVGTWNVVVKMFADPNAEPTVSKGKETNFMLGDKWLISHFKGEIFGAAFEGSSQTGFDPKKKKIMGTWVDTMSPFPMQIEGTFDEKTQTLTTIGIGRDPAGNEAKTKMVTTYNKDGTRTFTMYGVMDGKEAKMMQLQYTKAEEEKK
jgi:hypothetical protein